MMSSFKSRKVAKSFHSVEMNDGDGAVVHRSIGSSYLPRFDPFLILDEFSLAEPAGFPDHPHRGFQTVTYVFPTSKGGMLHEDFMGNKGELRAGDLQWMTAGRGIMHAEMPSNTKPACGLQLWINLPNKLKMIKPHYQEITRKSVPHVFNSNKTVEAIVFAGEVFGSKGPIETEASVTYVHFSLKPGAIMEYNISSSHNVFVYGVSGTGKCAGVDVRMSEAIAMEKEGDGVQLVAATNDSLDVVVMTGEPLNEPVSQYGPFVMSSREEIAQTLWDFDMRTNGFEAAHGWKSELARSREMSEFKTRQVAKSFQADEVSDGAGAHVHRSIGSPRLYNLDPFLMLDEFNVGLPGGFPDHPHRGFETVTYVLPTSKGHMCHEDFLGNKGELRPGDLQWMTPGRGIMHAEMPKSEVPAHGLQLWINLPSKSRMVEPKYQEISRDTVPHAFNEDKSIEAIVFAGEVFGYKGPVETEVPVTYVHFRLEPGANMEYFIPKTHNVFVYGVSGTGKCADANISAHEAIAMANEGDGVLLSAAEDDSLEVVVISGEPLNEPVHQYGPFVMSSREDIQNTLRDFDLRTNGFEEAHGWRSTIAPRRRHR